MVSVLLWNIYGLPSILTKYRNSQKRASVIATILAPYDVVILNEAFVHKKFFIASHPYQYIPLHSSWTLFDSGLMFLSRFPIVDSKVTMFSTRYGVDRFAAKSIAMITVQLDGDGQLLQVYGTHMQAGSSPGCQIARLQQSQQAVRFVSETRRPDARVVLAGDLNFGPVLDTEYRQWSFHYVNETDARARNTAYQTLLEGTGLEDAWKDGSREQSVEICRFFLSGFPKYSLEYEDMRAEGWEGPLSDTPALCLRW